MKKSGTLIFGGDVSLARHQNVMTPQIGYGKVLGTLEVIKKSDLSIVNLECAVASCGDFVDKKGEKVPYYFRARQEMLNILTEAQIDMVSVANNHSGDYGPEAFTETLDLLKQAGITALGGGLNATEAQEPVIRTVGGVVVGFVGIDFTTYFYAANEDTAGHYYLPHDRIFEWKDKLAQKINALKLKCDLVIPVVHWGPNFLKEPCDEVKELAKTLVSIGADAILGSSAHILQGVEIIDGKPVIYDAGNFLFDFRTEDKATGFFQLILSQNGVEEIRLIPTKAGYCYTTYAPLEEGKATLSVFKERCEKMGTNVDIENGPARIKLFPAAKTPNPAATCVETDRRKFATIPPLSTIPSQCLVTNIPPDAQIEEKIFGPVKLLGVKFKETHLENRDTNIIETYWQLSEDKIDQDFMIVQRLVLEGRAKESMWETDHEPCDWLWPTSRWKPNEIYYDKFFMRPPPKKDFVRGKYNLIMGIANVKTNEQYVEKFDLTVTVAEK